MRYSYNLVYSTATQSKTHALLIIRLANAFGSKLELQITLESSLNWL